MTLFLKNESFTEEFDAKGRVVDSIIGLVIVHIHSGSLVTVIEIFTEPAFSKCVNDKSAVSVTKAGLAISILLILYTDNYGPYKKAFAFHEGIFRALDAEVYFSDSYCSWRYGLNENTNGLLRQCWPKIQVSCRYHSMK